MLIALSSLKAHLVILVLYCFFLFQKKTRAAANNALTHENYNPETPVDQEALKMYFSIVQKYPEVASCDSFDWQTHVRDCVLKKGWHHNTHNLYPADQQLQIRAFFISNIVARQRELANSFPVEIALHILSFWPR